MRREFDRSVESKRGRINRCYRVFKRLHLRKINVADVFLKAFFTPDLRRTSDVRKKIHSVNHHQRFAVYPDVIGVPKVADHVEDDRAIVVIRVLLSDQHFVLETIPPACPVFICPANAEGNVWFIRFQQSLERQIQQPLAREPIIEITKAVNPMSFGEFGLMVHDYVNTKIIKAQIRR